jgi:FixJ family two-component response regulator/anti-sigma regulatory factor (Ser/Thr protein kinase)
MKPDSVLVVDDRKTLAQNLAKWLQQHGWDATPVYSGIEAIDVYSRGKFNVVLLDVRMPGMNGFETFKRLQHVDADVCVVFHTAYGDVSSSVEAIRCGAADFVEKPTPNETLAERLRAAMKHKKNEIEARRAMANKITFATGMAHKVNGKLAAIRASVGRLELPGGTPERQASVVADVRTLCDICHASLKIFAMLAKGQTAPLVAVKIKDIVTEAVSAAMFVTGNRGENPARIPPELNIVDELTVVVNNEVLTAAIECLIENAIEASASDSPISITSRESEDGLVTITVKDQGHGFSSEFLRQPLEPMKSTRNNFGHLGYGLYFASEVAALYGGSLTFANAQDGKGAVVTFTLLKKGDKL